jgi:hypothetical protein
LQLLTVQKTLALLIACTPLLATANPRAKTERTVIRVDGCDLLRSPAKFNGEMVDISGLAYGAFESFSISFECPGFINLEQSLYANDLRKFGFRTQQDAQMKKLDDALFPNHDLMARESHTARVRLVGRFRCHYDFPDCTNVTVHGDSSIVIRTILSVSNTDSASETPAKE